MSTFSSPLLAANTIVRIETSLGGLNVELYDTQAPITVTNFLDYVNINAYDGSVIHRSIPGFMIQGGGYAYVDFFGVKFFDFPKKPSIQNEFSPSRSNIRGTIAMAKLPKFDNLGNPVLGGGADSATSEWFINLADNNAPYDPNKPDEEQSLDYQNGGFTVFGKVLDSGMDVVDAIANLDTLAANIQMVNETPKPYLFFEALPLTDTGNVVLVKRMCINNDVDGACPETEDLATGGDGNGDGILDREQKNVTTFFTSLNGIATLATDIDMRFSSVTAINENTTLSWLGKFTSPPNQTLHFNNGMLKFTMVGTMGTARHDVTLYDGAATRPTYYYAYGPTKDNPTPHWYDFSYDSASGTGAEIKDDRIILHFVDGERGDDDLTANNSISHTGAQAVVTSTTNNNSAQGGGCSIATTSRDAMRAGDWMVVSLFLAFVALARRRTRRRHF